MAGTSIESVLEVVHDRGFTRDPERIDRTLDKIATQWRKFPDLRLTQLLYICLGNPKGDIYGVEDDVLERGLDAVMG